MNLNRYYEWANWGSGLAFLVAFFLTFWPNRRRISVAAILWSASILSLTGFRCYWILTQANWREGAPGFEMVFWTLPVLFFILAVVESFLLLPSIQQQRALWWGMILLVIIPGALILTIYFRRPELAFESLAFALLWFRIRERYTN